MYRGRSNESQKEYCGSIGYYSFSPGNPPVGKFFFFESKRDRKPLLHDFSSDKSK